MIKEKFEYNLPFRLTIQKQKKVLVVPHWHDNFEFIQVRKGQVLIQLNQTSFLANTGDIIFVPSKNIHAVYQVEETSEIMGMVIEQAYIRTMIEGYTTHNNLNAFFYFNQKILHYPSKHDLWSTLNDALLWIDKEYTDQEILYEMAIKEKIYCLIREMVRYHESDFSLLTQEDSHMMEPVLHYMQLHYADKLNINTLAQMLHMSESHFSRLFKQVTHKTPMTYLLDIRMKEAIKRLNESKDYIQTIASETGFYDGKYFSNQFKKYTGLTPKEFRRINQR